MVEKGYVMAESGWSLIHCDGLARDVRVVAGAAGKERQWSKCSVSMATGDAC